ncbi:MAG: glycosyltransferase family 8 protein [Patescibacteria group bacterium]
MILNELNNDIIKVVLAADDNYAQHLGVTMVSILENHLSTQKIEFHILDNNINSVNIQKIKLIGQKYKVDLFFYLVSSSDLDNYPKHNYLPRSTYLRVLIPELLPRAINKVLYLDTDIVVLGDISELYNQGLGDFSLGAVRDIMADEILQIHFDKNVSNYFNAGVLLLNLEKWRGLRLAEKSFELIRLYGREIIRADQDILNSLFVGDWQPLDKRFNSDLKRSNPSREIEANTVILHYSDRVKPWQYIFYGKSQKYYLKYLKMTPWADFNFSDKNFSMYIRKYLRVFILALKRSLVSFIPNSLLNIYRKILWSTYKVNKSKTF